MDFGSLFCFEFFVMIYTLMPFFVAFGFFLVATSRARNERRMAEERDIEEARAEEEKDTLKGKDESDDESDEDESLYIFRHNRKGVIKSSPGAPPNSPTGY